MNSFAKFHEFKEPTGSPASRSDTRTEDVLSELDRILASRFFRSAERSKQFLKYVVEHKLAGHPEQLKERTIGTDVFLRPKDYSTGDDAVVQGVQSGRSTQKNRTLLPVDSNSSSVRIELPVRSYSPVFHWPSASAPAGSRTLPFFYLKHNLLRRRRVTRRETSSLRPVVSFWQ